MKSIPFPRMCKKDRKCRLLLRRTKILSSEPLSIYLRSQGLKLIGPGNGWASESRMGYA